MNSEEKNTRPGAELSEDELKEVSGGIWVDVYTCPNCHREWRCVGPGPHGCVSCGTPWTKERVWFPDIP